MTTRRVLSRLERLSSLLDDNAMRLVVTQNGASYYEHGAESEHDAALDDASEALSGSGSVAKDDRTLFVQDVSHTGRKRTTLRCMAASRLFQPDFLRWCWRSWRLF